MELFKIILVIFIIIFLYKICSYKEDLIEGHLGYSPDTGEALEHVHSEIKCLNDANEEITGDNCTYGPNSRPDSSPETTPSAADIIRNFHIDDLVLAQYKQNFATSLPQSVYQWANSTNQNGDLIYPQQKAEVDTWLEEGNLLVAKVVNYKDNANLILVEFMLPRWTRLIDSNYREQHWVTPGAPGRLRNSTDNWINYHISIYPNAIDSLTENWNTNNWTSTLSGYAYDNTNNVFNNNFEYGGVIHYNTIIYSNIQPTKIKNKSSLAIGGPYMPISIVNCLLERGEETINTNINGRCKIRIKQTPGNNGTTNCKYLQDTLSMTVNSKYSNNCDTCKVPKLADTQLAKNTGPIDFVTPNPPNKVPRNNTCQVDFDGNNPLTCNTERCIYSPPTEADTTAGTEATPATCTPRFDWTQNIHPYALKCAKGYDGTINTGICSAPSNQNLYEASDENESIPLVTVDTQCTKIPMCKSPFDITQAQIDAETDTSIRNELTTLRNMTLNYTSVDEGPDDSYLNKDNFNVIARCKPGYFNIPNPTCSDPSIVSQSDCINNGTCSHTSTDISIQNSVTAATTADTCNAIDGATWTPNNWILPDLTTIDLTNADVIGCENENEYYTLGGCVQRNFCFSDTNPNGRRTTSENEICVSNFNTCRQLLTGIPTGSEEEENIINSDECTRVFTKSTGNWVDILENEDFGCGNTCNINITDLSKKKLKIWRTENQGQEQEALSFANGPQSYNVKTTSKEDKIKVIRNPGTPDQNIITVLKGDELQDGDIRIGYYGHYIDDISFWTNLNVQGSTPNNQLQINDYVTITDPNDANYGQSGIIKNIDNDILNLVLYIDNNNVEVNINKSNVKDNKKWHYVYCDSADPTQCENESCEYDICSKHCVSNWEPTDVDFTKINSNSIIYDHGQMNDVEWGNCMKRDGGECGSGYQARVAVVTEQSQNGGGCFFPNEYICKPKNNLSDQDRISAETTCPSITNETGCDNENLCQWVNKTLNNFTDRYEYRKCRGDSRGQWNACNSNLDEYMVSGQGFPLIKDEFRTYSNLLSTPIELDCSFSGDTQTSDQCPTGCTYTPEIPETPSSCNQLQMVGGNTVTCPTLDETSCVYPCQWDSDNTQCNVAPDPGCSGLSETTCEVGGDNTSGITIEAGKCSWNPGTTGTSAICEPYVNYEPFTNQIIEGFQGDVLPCNSSSLNPISDFYYNGLERKRNIEQVLPDQEKKIGRIGKKLNDDESTYQDRGLIDKINTLNQLQLDYENQDETILPNGEVYPGLLTINFLERFETNIPQEIYEKLTTSSIDSTRSQRLVTSIPVGGNISRIDWYKLFCIRIIYILELLNLITIQRINTIINSLKNDHPSRLCDKYLLDYTYIYEKYGVADSQKNIGVEKENWNIYPFQWMYGGENNTGLNSQNEDEVILYFVKLIRIFYYPCNNMNYHQLDPMEQYIRFNLDLYRHIQINQEIINVCQIAKNNEYRLFRNNNEYCNQDLKNCGNNNIDYPEWFRSFMDNCNSDFRKCMLNDNGSLSTPESIEKTIIKWKCIVGENNPYTPEQCCDALNLPFDSAQGDCSREKPLNQIFSSNLEDIVPLEDSQLLNNDNQTTNLLKKKTLSFNNITQDMINETRNELLSKNITCGLLSNSECGVATSEHPERVNCSIKTTAPNQGRCVFQPTDTMSDQRFDIGTSKIKLDHNVTGEKWDEWLSTLVNETSNPSSLQHPTRAQNWISGIDWKPGTSITENDWELKTAIQNQYICKPNPVNITSDQDQDTADITCPTLINENSCNSNNLCQWINKTISDFGEEKRIEGSQQKYNDNYCNFWGDDQDSNNICTQLSTLNNNINYLEDNIANLNNDIESKNQQVTTLENQISIIDNQIQIKETNKELLEADIASLINRPEQCTPCDNCINCLECPSKQEYANAKGICPTCNCTEQISTANENLVNQCNSIINEQETLLERRNIDEINNLKFNYEEELKNLDNLIKESSKEIDDSKLKDAICKKDMSIFSVSQDSNTTQYLNLIEENELLQKEYNREKNKSWWEKLLF